MSELFRNVVVCPLGRLDDPGSLGGVAGLVDDTGRVRMLSVVPAPSRLQRMLGSDDRLDALVEEARAAETGRLEALADVLGMDAAVEVGVGEAATTILGSVVARGDDLVVVTTDAGRSEAATVKRLFRKCPCPVWLVRPRPDRPRRVMAAVNLEPDEKALNLELLELAARLAGALDAELHVVHAWEVFGEAAMRRSAFWNVPDTEIERLADDEFVARADALGELLADPDLPPAPWHQHLPKGPPVDAVVEAVDEYGIDLLVIGTLGRSGVPGLVMGNTAEAVLDEVTCSVLAVKPPGFRSPVEPPPVEPGSS